MKKNNYQRWGNDNSESNEHLRKYYLTKNNKELANELNRSEDSIRKQLKKLGFIRIKEKVVKIPKKRGRKKKPFSIYIALSTGIKKRNKVERDEKRKKSRDEKNKVNKKKEKSWADKELEIINCTSPDLSKCVSKTIYISGRETIIFAKTKKKLNSVIRILLKREKDGASNKRSDII